MDTSAGSSVVKDNRMKKNRCRRRQFREGDVVLGRVTSVARTQDLIETPEGRYAILYEDDLLLVTLACRESTRWGVGGVPPAGINLQEDFVMSILCPPVSSYNLASLANSYMLVCPCSIGERLRRMRG